MDESRTLDFLLICALCKALWTLGSVCFFFFFFFSCCCCCARMEWVRHSWISARLQAGDLETRACQIFRLHSTTKSDLSLMQLSSETYYKAFLFPKPPKDAPAGAPDITRLRYSAIPISVCPLAQWGPKISLKQVTHGMRCLCGNHSAFNLR